MHKKPPFFYVGLCIKHCSVIDNFFQNKIVVITGGSEGIGKSLAEACVKRGAKVAVCGRNHDKLYQLQMQFADKPLLTFVADVSNPQDCSNFINAAIKTFGGIDILINNAGISMRALFKDISIDVVKQLMDVNFFGALYCTKYALDSIVARKGIIVGISSIAGYRGLPGRTGYSASKHALNGFMEALRTELFNTGTHVMWVSPGFTASNIRHVALNKEGQFQQVSPLNEKALMSVEECATHILQAIEKRKRTLVLTIKGKQTVFLNKFFPKLADKLIYKFFFKNGELVK